MAEERNYIEEGWQSFSRVIPEDASEEQREDQRVTFYAGAQHFFTAITEHAGKDDEDLSFFENVDRELREFLMAYKKKHGVP